MRLPKDVVPDGVKNVEVLPNERPPAIAIDDPENEGDWKRRGTLRITFARV